MPESYEEFDPTDMRIELYYLKNNCFIPEGYIFKNAHKIKVPVYMIQGRYDMVCPPITAFELDKLLPNSKLIWATSGHKAERESWNVMRMAVSKLTN